MTKVGSAMHLFQLADEFKMTTAAMADLCDELEIPARSGADVVSPADVTRLRRAAELVLIGDRCVVDLRDPPIAAPAHERRPRPYVQRLFTPATDSHPAPPQAVPPTEAAPQPGYVPRHALMPHRVPRSHTPPLPDSVIPTVDPRPDPPLAAPAPPPAWARAQVPVLPPAAPLPGVELPVVDAPSAEEHGPDHLVEPSAATATAAPGPTVRRGLQLVAAGLVVMLVMVLAGAAWLMLIGFVPVLAGCHQIGSAWQEDLASPA